LSDCTTHIVPMKVKETADEAGQDRELARQVQHTCCMPAASCCTHQQLIIQGVAAPVSAMPSMPAASCTYQYVLLHVPILLKKHNCCCPIGTTYTLVTCHCTMHLSGAHNCWVSGLKTRYGAMMLYIHKQGVAGCGSPCLSSICCKRSCIISYTPATHHPQATPSPTGTSSAQTPMTGSAVD